jgi:uncharacterized repeat protein (TIGR01451 family)
LPRSSQAAILVAVVALTAFAMILPAAAINVVGPNFEIDGDLDQDSTNFDDWETVIPGPGSLGLPGVHIPDPHSKKFTDDNTFTAGGKFYDTGTWDIDTGKIGAAQNELTNVGVYAVPSSVSTDGDDWLVLSLERTKKEGTFALWFELNQVVWDAGVSSTPTRSTGDLAIGFELSGNPESADDFQVAVLAYDESGPESLCLVAGDGTISPGSDPCPVFNGNWHYRFLGSAGDLGDVGAGEMNLVAVDPSVVDGWDSFDAQGNPRALIGAFEFAEAAIDLTELGVTVGCPGFGSAHAATVASLSSTADAKDLAGPAALPIDCSISGTKFEDNNFNGLFDTTDGTDTGIEDWPISLYLDDGDGEFDADDELVEEVLTDANGDYTFDGLSDGTYHVVEGDAPDGGDPTLWQHQAVRSTDGTPDGDGTPVVFTRIINITIDSSNTTSTGNDFLNAQTADISVAKEGTISYTASVSNSATGATANGVTLSDTLPGDLTWTVTGITDDENNDGSKCVGDLEEGDTVSVIDCSGIVLAAGESFSLTVAADITDSSCDTDVLLGNTASGTATNEAAEDTDDNSDTAAICAPAPAPEP